LYQDQSTSHAERCSSAKPRRIIPSAKLRSRAGIERPYVWLIYRGHAPRQNIDHQLDHRASGTLTERPRGSEAIFDTEAAMRKKALVLALIMAGIGLSAMLSYVAVNPKTTSAAEPAIAAVSPFAIMKELGKDLPPAKSVDPF
jgi:hypothetical protein